MFIYVRLRPDNYNGYQELRRRIQVAYMQSLLLVARKATVFADFMLQLLFHQRIKPGAEAKQQLEDEVQ